jgi:hypothetical protein
MIALFKLVVEGDSKPGDRFYNRVKEIAEEEGMKIHEFSNELMMPTENLFHEDQTEMVLERVNEKWIAKDDRLESIKKRGNGLLVYAVIDGDVEWMFETRHENDVYAFMRKAIDRIVNGVPDVTNMGLFEKHLSDCFKAKTPDMVAVSALYSALRCVQEILKAHDYE